MKLLQPAGTEDKEMALKQYGLLTKGLNYLKEQEM